VKPLIFPCLKLRWSEVSGIKKKMIIMTTKLSKTSKKISSNKKTKANAAIKPQQIPLSNDITTTDLDTNESINLHGKISIEDQITLVKINMIQPDPNQPRKYFDTESLSNLKSSIESESLHNPILVRKDENNINHFIIVDGQRRWQACLELKHSTIKCRIVASDAQGYQILALTQNFHREDLLPIEKANAFASLFDKMKGENEKARQRELLKIVNASESFVSELLKISTLDEEIKNEAETSKLWSIKKLLRLARIKNPEAREALFQELKAIVDKKNKNTFDIKDADADLNSDEEYNTAQSNGTNTVTIEQIQKRLGFWKKYIEKIKQNDWKESEIEIIKKELQSILDIIDK
jgi:ParB family chromosome partitioning protein